jgi:tetratricopeptide (TPR) repeat protein
LKEAADEFNAVFKYNPNIPDALGHYSYLLAFLGKKTEAMAVVAKAAELDPFSPMITVNCWTTSWLCSDYGGMLKQSKHLVDIHPNNWAGQFCTGIYHWSQSEYDQSIEAFTLSLNQNYGALTLSCLGCVYGIAGQKDKAYKILTKLNQMAMEATVASFCFAKVYAGLNEMDEALKYLDNAAEERTDHLIFLDYYRRDLVPLFDDPRVLDYMEKLGVPREQNNTMD